MSKHKWAVENRRRDGAGQVSDRERMQKQRKNGWNRSWENKLLHTGRTI